MTMMPNTYGKMENSQTNLYVKKSQYRQSFDLKALPESKYISK